MVVFSQVKSSSVVAGREKNVIIYNNFKYKYRMKQKCSGNRYINGEQVFKVFYCVNHGISECKVKMRADYEHDPNLYYISSTKHNHNSHIKERMENEDMEEVGDVISPGQEQGDTQIVGPPLKDIGRTTSQILFPMELEDGSISTITGETPDEVIVAETHVELKARRTLEWFKMVLISNIHSIYSKFCREHLDGEQLDSAQQPLNGNILIQAGPGAGKTRTLIGRILKILKESKRCDSFMSLSFTKNAQKEVIDRLKKEILKRFDENDNRVLDQFMEELFEVSTFHQFCLKKYNDFLQDVDVQAMEEDQLTKIVDLIIKDGYFLSRSVNLKDARKRIDTVSFAKIIENQRDNQLDEVDLKLYKMFKIRMKTYNTSSTILLTFDEILMHFFVKLREGSISMDFHHLDYILVDEFQDMSKMMLLILEVLVKKGRTNENRRKLFLAGDEDQQIYTWSGSHVEDMRVKIKNTFGDDLVELYLKKNHRSKRNIHLLCRKLIRKITDEESKEEYDDSCVFVHECEGYNDQLQLVYERCKKFLEENKSNNRSLGVLSRVSGPLKSLLGKFDENSEAFKNVSLWKSGNHERRKINLSTIHMSKSSEFDEVDIMDFIRFIHPYQLKGQELTLAVMKSERRLAFVGSSRAIDKLTFYTYSNVTGNPSFRTSISKRVGNSEYLDELSNFVIRISKIRVPHPVLEICRGLPSYNLDDIV